MKKILFALVIILFIAHQCDKKWQKSINNSSHSTTKVVDTSCFRCGGSGKIARYSMYGCKCEPSYTSECSKEVHKSSCISSGSKTCPCCNGTGKRS